MCFLLEMSTICGLATNIQLKSSASDIQKLRALFAKVSQICGRVNNHTFRCLPARQELRTFCETKDDISQEKAVRLADDLKDYHTSLPTEDVGAEPQVQCLFVGCAPITTLTD